MHEHPDYREPGANPPEEHIQLCDSEDFHKFFALDEEKRERILNAAMKEFLAGYKKASTDTIVREAGISKGLLFHYFGTKERLYNFLINYAIETIRKEYIDLINVVQPDILDSIWQMTLLKRDISNHYPDMFDFLTSTYMNVKDNGGSVNENLMRFMQVREEVVAKIYAHADKTLFRDDIDSETAMNIINWAMQGYSYAKMAEVDSSNPGAHAREHYDKYLEEFQKILGILRLCFYQKEA